MKKKAEIQNIIDKYKSRYEQLHLRELCREILSDIEYLQQHSRRTCENCFELIPRFPIDHRFPIQDYSPSRGCQDTFKKAMLSDNYWKTECDYALTLKDVIEDMLTMEYILSSIFNHEKDKGATTREENSYINLEYIDDFLVFNKYFKGWYDEDVTESIVDWTIFYHSYRHSDKIPNFLNHLKEIKSDQPK